MTPYALLQLPNGGPVISVEESCDPDCKTTRNHLDDDPQYDIAAATRHRRVQNEARRLATIEVLGKDVARVLFCDAANCTQAEFDEYQRVANAVMPRMPEVHALEQDMMAAAQAMVDVLLDMGEG